MTTEDVPLVTGRAFAELAMLSPSVSVPKGGPDTTHPEERFLEELAKLEDPARLGVLRAEQSIKPEDFDGDPLRMLRDGAALFYEGRCNYGATSLEVTQRKAIVRFVASEQLARSTVAQPLLRGFLERAIELVSGERMAARFAGNTPRVGGRFARPMYNAVFEFDLEP